MTSLRERVLDELQRRNYSSETTRGYIYAIKLPNPPLKTHSTTFTARRASGFFQTPLSKVSRLDFYAPRQDCAPGHFR